MLTTEQLNMRREVKRMGGSVGVLISRDFAEAMNVKHGSAVRLTLVGRQVVVEPVDDVLADGVVQRAFGAVLRRHGRAFERLAAYDRGGWRPRKR